MDGLLTKPRTLDEWVPTNPNLWEKLTDLAQGKRKAINIGDKEYTAPREGKGFKRWPSPRATGWCVRIYNLAGGRWKKRGEKRALLLDGNMVERVAERHQSRIAQVFGPDIRRLQARYEDKPKAGESCKGCYHWAAVSEIPRGACLRHEFPGEANGWCPSHAKIAEDEN